jgi:hypothetical protein
MYIRRDILTGKGYARKRICEHLRSQGSHPRPPLEGSVYGVMLELVRSVLKSKKGSTATTVESRILRQHTHQYQAADTAGIVNKWWVKLS